MQLLDLVVSWVGVWEADYESGLQPERCNWESSICETVDGAILKSVYRVWALVPEMSSHASPFQCHVDFVSLFEVG
jgi:hypothetical protein